MTELMKYTAACRALAECVSVDEVKTIHNNAKAFAAYAKSAGDKHMLADAQRIIWRAKDRMGELLIEMAENGERGLGRPKKEYPKTILSDLGITPMLSSEVQRVAAMDTKLKEEALASDNPDKEMRRQLSKLPHNPRKPRKAPKPHDKAAAIVALSSKGMTDSQVSAATGVPQRTVRKEVEHEAIRREAEAQIDPSTLSLTAQQKLESAIRQHQRKLDQEFERRVLAEIKQRINEIVLPSYNKRLAEYELVVKARKGVMPRATFRKILACLHSDRSMSAKSLEEAFHAFEKLEIALCSEKELPTQSTSIPTNYDELMELKRKTTEARRNKHNGMVHR